MTNLTHLCDFYKWKIIIKRFILTWDAINKQIIYAVQHSLSAAKVT